VKANFGGGNGGEAVPVTTLILDASMIGDVLSADDGRILLLQRHRSSIPLPYNDHPLHLVYGPLGRTLLKDGGLGGILSCEQGRPPADPPPGGPSGLSPAPAIAAPYPFQAPLVLRDLPRCGLVWTIEIETP
jgi:hypothetical protein